MNQYKHKSESIKYDILEVSLQSAIDFLTERAEELKEIGVDPKDAYIDYYLDDVHYSVELRYKVPLTEEEVEILRKKEAKRLEVERQQNLQEYYRLKEKLGL